MTNQKPYEAKAQTFFGEVCVPKALVQAAGFGTRSVPAYVSEWIVTRHAPEGVLDDEARLRIRTFLNNHLPTRDQKEQLKARLQSGETLTVLDQFSLTVDLQRNLQQLSIPCLDERKAGVERWIADQYPLLFGSGVWGVGKLQYYPPDTVRKEGQIWKVEASAGLMLLANIPLDEQRQPRHRNLFEELPAFLGETAFIDRIHGILPGWKLPRIEQAFIATGVGFKADYFGDMLHHLRTRAGYEQIVQQRASITGTNDRRDLIAITRLAAGYCKLLFPHGELSDDDVREYCLKPAIDLRQRVRQQLALLDPEYAEVDIGCVSG